MSLGLVRRPFAPGGTGPGLVVLPTGEEAGLAEFRTLLVRERHELETVLGGPLHFVERVPVDFAGPVCLIGPASLNPDLANRREGSPVGEAVVEIDRSGACPLVIVDGPTIDAVGEALNLLWTAVRTGAARTVVPTPRTADAILDLIVEEVGATWPSFTRSGIDWRAVVAEHRDDVLAHDADLPSLQRLFARLGDAHTWARDPRVNARMPYRTWFADDRVWLAHVPRWSAGWHAGARAGDEFMGEDLVAWRGRIGAVARTLPVVTGYRVLAGRVGDSRSFCVRKANGDLVRWEESYLPFPWGEPLSWRVLPSGTGYLRIRGWLSSETEALDAAFADLASAPTLIVDLRGNVGGNLIAAQAFRDRFLTGRTQLGTIRFSRDGQAGLLGESGPIVGEPPRGAARWTKPVRFLVDRECYSATEDALLGLQGLPHVQLVGEPTGGGSGRPRFIGIDEGRAFTVSTALTYDRRGRCIEGNGVPVDRSLPSPWVMHRRGIDAIAAADRGW